MNIKTPIATTHWIASDGKAFKNLDEAERHEVFLAVVPHLKRGMPASARDVIMELAKHFDFTPRSGEKVSPPEEQS